MNFNQLKKLNSAMKSFIQQNTAKKTNYRIEELKNQIEEIKAELKDLEAIENKTFDDLENIRMFNIFILTFSINPRLPRNDKMIH